MNDISKWIWTETAAENDSYSDFYDSFDYSGGRVELKISADSNYTVFVNGVFASSDQYPDFPHYKVYDSIDITEYCKLGKNSLAVTVWYYGKANMSYFPGNAALRYELYTDDRLACYSNEQTLSRKSLTYKSGYGKEITVQLGFSFYYDATAEDGWMTGELSGFAKSTAVSQQLPMYLRPVKKLTVGSTAQSVLCKSENGKHFLYDIGFEEVGYFAACINSQVEQKITVCYGEHIVDGGVRRRIGSRDFSFEIFVGAGKTEYTNYFRRLGLRYLEIFAEHEINVEWASVKPCFYPLEKTENTLYDGLDRKIYDVAVRTLELCMHDHYEDCPWREQALYAMDSRNQILCGYYAFKEFEFPRANLLLMSKDSRADGLLSICTPSGNDLTIPSFSLHYFIEVYEYTRYSGDMSLAREIFPKLTSVLDVFLNRMEGGLVSSFEEKCHWNFYEWADGLSDPTKECAPGTLEAALNCLLSIALDRMDKLCRMLGTESRYGELAEKINSAIFDTFFDGEKLLFKNIKGEEKYSELVNALAVLCGAAKGETADYICRRLTCDSGLTPITLSMTCFKYDALLKTDTERYRSYILDDIRHTYKKMLDAGATSFWETEDGERDFHNAGSLCHGWSAMPVYYYNILK